MHCLIDTFRYRKKINWRVLPPVKTNTPISDIPSMQYFVRKLEDPTDVIL
jgi:hypothetical protein